MGFGNLATWQPGDMIKRVAWWRCSRVGYGHQATRQLGNMIESFLERDETESRSAIREFRASHTSDELFLNIARFAVMAYAPSQHAKHALLACLSAYDIREECGERWDALLAECAIYAAQSRQPWSEPPILDPPAIDDHQTGDVDELRAA